MAALVQSFPQQTTTVTMLQARPSSASGMLQTSQNPQLQYQNNSSHMQRNSIHGMGSMVGGSGSGYRGTTGAAPIAPYAFTSTPSLSNLAPQPQYLRTDQRSISAPGPPGQVNAQDASRPRYVAHPSISTSSSTSASSSSASQKSGSKDDSSITTPTPRMTLAARPRPQSTIITSFSTDMSASTGTSSPKTQPNRYRRPNNARGDSSSSVNVTTGASTNGVLSQKSSNTPSQTNKVTSQGKSKELHLPISSFATAPSKESTTEPRISIDDIQVGKSSSTDPARRYRRRSIHTIEAAGYVAPTSLAPQGSRQLSSANGRIDQHHNPLGSSPVGLAPSHGRNTSSDSINSSTRSSSHSRPSSSKREGSASAATSNPAPSLSFAQVVSSAFATPEQPPPKNDGARQVNIPPRASSADVGKRTTNPSPLSRPMTMSPESPASKESFASTVNGALQSTAKPTYAQVANGTHSGSPAAQHLAALNEKEGKKTKTSRLRRAFSFGSAADLRRASAENSAAIKSAAGSVGAQSPNGTPQDPHEAEQARIAERQEAAGIGSNIYSGQGNVFSGSTDNLSISSTASSASIMIRKMGKGMKKSTRSLVGLFRPKSVIGVPAADAALPVVSQAEVSRVTVEAEREKVNVHLHPRDQAGATGYPRLERNSIDAVSAGNDRLGSSGTESTRRSIVGGERERAEVLAAVKKGILKRSGTDSGNSSPIIRPSDAKSPLFNLPQIPTVSDSPNSSAPSTPNDEQQGHRRTGSVVLGGEDYFMTAMRLQTNSKSVPTTPQGGMKRNATFSPRIQFHDTWPSGEYDRRGEIATCNRLTPMLAQQIKEELNTFKMEMEVHENSKIYTHFF